MPEPYWTIAENVDGKGIRKIRGLICRYTLKSFLQAVQLEMHDTVSNTDPKEEDYQIAKKVERSLDRIVG